MSLSESYGVHSSTITYIAEGNRIKRVSKGKNSHDSLKSNMKRIFKVSVDLFARAMTFSL